MMSAIRRFDYFPTMGQRLGQGLFDLGNRGALATVAHLAWMGAAHP